MEFKVGDAILCNNKNELIFLNNLLNNKILHFFGFVTDFPTVIYIEEIKINYSSLSYFYRRQENTSLKRLKKLQKIWNVETI